MMLVRVHARETEEDSTSSLTKDDDDDDGGVGISTDIDGEEAGNGATI
jgi:hypothetical protein